MSIPRPTKDLQVQEAFVVLYCDRAIASYKGEGADFEGQATCEVFVALGATFSHFVFRHLAKASAACRLEARG